MLRTYSLLPLPALLSRMGASQRLNDPARRNMVEVASRAWHLKRCMLDWYV